MARTLVLIGGGSLPPSVFSEALSSVLESVGDFDRPLQFLICTLASLDPEAHMPIEEGFLTAAKGLHPIKFTKLDTRDFLSDPRASQVNTENNFPVGPLQQLESADLLFFTGGDQGRILDVLEGTAFEDLMLNRWRSGKLVLSGTSAGLQVFSQKAFTGESLSEEGAFGEQPQTRKGFGALAPHLVLDQHFLKRNRMQRLMSVCFAHHPCLGLGVDEETALVLNFPLDSPIGSGKVVGNSAVCYLDTRSSQRWKTSWEGVRSGLVWAGGQIPFEIEMN